MKVLPYRLTKCRQAWEYPHTGKRRVHALETCLAKVEEESNCFFYTERNKYGYNVAFI